MLTTLAILAAAVGGVLAYAASRPSAFCVQRSTRIEAPPEAVFPLINDFQRWMTWSPYEKVDPDMKRSFSGPTGGEGAVYAWDGKKIGAGRMEIAESTPASKVTMTLDFFRPFRASNVAEFTLTPAGGATELTWAMRGNHAFVPKLVGIFVDMDRMIGKDFEAGLGNLKSVVER